MIETHGHGRDPETGKFGAVSRQAEREGDPRV
jgi:hypothetical protein